MAKLSANGTEIARFRVTTGTGDSRTIREVSLRENGYVLSKVKLSGGWTGWTRYARFTEVGSGSDRRAHLRRFLAKRGEVEDL